MFYDFFAELTVQKISFMCLLLLVGATMFRLIEEYFELNKLNDALSRGSEQKEPLINKIVNAVPVLGKLKKRLDDDLYRCGMNKSSYEVISQTFVGAFIGFFTGLSINNFIAALLLTVCGFYIPLQLIDNKIYTRTRNIDRQIMHLIQLFLNEYQKTSNITEVFTVILKDLEAPLDKEVGIVIRELDSGIEVRTALNRFSESLDNEWIYLFVNTVIMNKENGTEITKTLMDTLLKIANKEIIEGERDTEIYSGKVLTYIMVAFVPISFVACCFMQEEAYDLYFKTTGGQLVVDFAIISAVGGYLLSKVVERV